MLDALFAQQLLCAFDGQTVLVQQLFDTAQKVHIGGAIITPPAGPFDRFDLAELAFPKAQHMGGRIQPLSDFTDRPKCVFGFGHDLALVPVCNAIFHQMRGAECQNAAGVDRNLFAGLGVAAHAGRFVTHRERAER